MKKMFSERTNHSMWNIFGFSLLIFIGASRYLPFIFPKRISCRSAILLQSGFGSGPLNRMFILQHK